MNHDKQYYLTCFIGAISFGSFIMLAKHTYISFKRSRDTNKAKSTRVYTPSQLIEAIRKQDNYIKNKFEIKNNEENQPELAIGQVFLQGQIKTIDPVYSQYSEFVRNHPLIYKVTYDKEIFNLDKTNPQDRSYSLKDFPENAQYEKVQNFFIADRNSNGALAEVDFDHDCDVSSSLQYFGHKDKLYRLSLSDRFIGFLLFLLKAFLEMLGGKKNPFAQPIRGICMGFRETELGIKVDSFLSAYGEIVYNFKTNTLKMELPKVLVGDKNLYIQKLQQLWEDSSYVRNFYFFIWALTMVYIGRRGFHYWKKYQLEQEKQKKLQQQEADKVAKQLDVDAIQQQQHSQLQ